MIDDADDFRSRARKRAEAAMVVKESDDTGDYRAWGKSHPNERVVRLDFKLVPSSPDIEEEGEEITLSHLTTITYRHSQKWDDLVTMLFADRIVTIEGRNLREFRRELAAGKVDFVQEFYAAKWPVRPAADKPIVTKITIDQPGDEEPPPPSLRLVKNDQD